MIQYDIAAGLVSSGVVSPFMTVIDSAIIKSQFDKTSLFRALNDTVRGYFNGTLQWKTPLRIMTGVYASTYITANVIEGICKANDVAHRIPTTLGTSFVNIVAIAFKDRAYAKLYGTPSNTFPRASYALFAMRDCLTITSSFVLKNDFKTYLEEQCGLSRTNADVAASFIVPMTAQVFSSPLHIVALDLYQRPVVEAGARWHIVKKQFLSTCTGRVVRVIPAFGVGGFVNDLLKERWCQLS
jgi:hypothetical protein